MDDVDIKIDLTRWKKLARQLHTFNHFRWICVITIIIALNYLNCGKIYFLENICKKFAFFLQIVKMMLLKAQEILPDGITCTISSCLKGVK